MIISRSRLALPVSLLQAIIVRVGILRDGFKLLVGHDQYDRLGDLQTILDNWHDGLRKEYEHEFKTLGHFGLLY